MKKSLFILTSLITLLSLPAKADEGMWTLYNLPNAVYETMKQENYELPYGALYQGDDAVKNCVVNFGGFCSGVVVSPDGLVFTNHHCGFEAIRSHSTVEHDYMLNGFVSNSYEEELPNKNLFVSFMVEQKDITPMLDSLGIQKMNNDERYHFLDSLENVMLKDVVKQDSTLRVEILPFYEGNKYYMTTYRDYEDVRLVFALPKSMGKFGGETDNWMWPQDGRAGEVFEGQCADEAEEMGSGVVAGLSARIVLNDHRLSRQHQPLSVELWHPGASECDERADVSDP